MVEEIENRIVEAANAFRIEFDTLPFKVSVSPYFWTAIGSEPFGEHNTLKNISYTVSGKVMRLQCRKRGMGDTMDRDVITVSGTTTREYSI